MQYFFTGTVSPRRYEYICKRYGFKNDGSQDNEIITKIHRLFLERIRNYEQLKETPHAVFFTGTVSPQRYEYICKRYGFNELNLTIYK